MAETNNGWGVISEADVERIYVADDADGAQVRKGVVARAFIWLIDQIDRRVEPVVKVNGWRSAAYNREVGGDPGSNHISGTAVDINGHLHPYEILLPASQRGAAYRSGWSSAQVAEIRRILAESGGLFKWGLDFKSPWRDAMHFDISSDKRFADVVAFVDTIEEDDMLNPEQPIPVKGEAAKILGLKEQTLAGMLGYSSADYRQNRRDHAAVIAGQKRILAALGDPVDEAAIAAQIIAAISDDIEEAVQEAVASIPAADAEAIATATVDLLRKRLVS